MNEPRIVIRVSPEDKASFQKAASAQGLDLSKWLLSIARAAVNPPKPSEKPIILVEQATHVHKPKPLAPRPNSSDRDYSSAYT